MPSPWRMPAETAPHEMYPGRPVVSVDARAIFACGGGIHCITQQQPAAPTRPDTPGTAQISA